MGTVIQIFGPHSNQVQAKVFKYPYGASRRKGPLIRVLTIRVLRVLTTLILKMRVRCVKDTDPIDDYNEYSLI